MTNDVDRAPDAAEWDERYGGSDRIWSGEPNGALVAEVAYLPPGKALDIGCGEGADAVWLARRGWQVTALDVSNVALERARHHASDAGVEVTWVHAGVVEAQPAAGEFDLVSAMYPAVRKTPDTAAERALLEAVAPGGTLLVVHHAIDPDHLPDHAPDNGFDPSLYVLPADVEAQLDGTWRVEVSERRPRVISGGSGAHHAEDVVLRATRL
jgi:SAM-dependent methyltransferase